MGNPKSSSRYSYPYINLDKPLRLQEVETSRISRKSANVGGKVIRPTHRPPLPLPTKKKKKIFLVLISFRGSLGPKTIVDRKDRTRNLSPCSSVPQPTAPLCNGQIQYTSMKSNMRSISSRALVTLCVCVCVCVCVWVGVGG